MLFTLKIQKSATETWEMPCSSLSQSEELNADRTASFNIETQHGDVVAQSTGVTLEYILSGGYREAYVYDQDGTCTFSGFIDEVNLSAGEQKKGTYSVTAKGFFALLEKRMTAASQLYTSTDAGEIAWDLIDTTQAEPYGDFGITLGLIEPTKDRDRTYSYRPLKECIQKLTSGEVKDGFDFDIDVAKAFNVYAYKGDDREDIIFDADHNVNTWQVRKTGLLGMCNHVVVFGAGNGDDMAVVEKTSANSYKEAYFLLVDGMSDKDNGDLTLLGDKGQKYIDTYQAPIKSPVTLTCDYGAPRYTEYSVGDRVRVKIKEADIDTMMRVTKKSVDMSGNVNVTLKLVL